MTNSSSLFNSSALTRANLILTITTLVNWGMFFYQIWDDKCAFTSDDVTDLCLAIVTTTGIFYLRRATRSVLRFSEVIEKVSAGDFEARIIHIKEKGDLQRLANSINRLVDITDAFVREAQHSMEAVGQGKYYRKVIETGLPGLFRHTAEAINDVTRSFEKRIIQFQQNANRFEENIGSIITSVSSAATELQFAAENMMRVAETTSNESGAVLQTAEHSSHNVGAVAAATEQLTASIRVIDQRMTHAAEIASKGQKEAEQTNNLVRGLSEAAQKIGDIIQLINTIASQTNLLALNATIEAARAGEAGKGFAVVASEVKNLADQTAKATDEISTQVGNMQEATRSAVSAIQHIGATINEINTISSDITLSIDEQRKATQEISRNAQEASASTSQVSQNVNNVCQGALNSKASSTQVLAAAQDLNHQASFLRTEAAKFLNEVREG